MTYNLDIDVSGLITLTAGADNDIVFAPSGSGACKINSANVATEAYADGGYTRTVVNSAASPYSVLATDTLIGVDCSGGAVELRLPDISTLTDSKQQVTIVDETGNAAINNITVKPDSASGDFLLDQTFASGGFVMVTEFESLTLYTNEATRWLARA